MMVGTMQSVPLKGAEGIRGMEMGLARATPMRETMAIMVNCMFAVLEDRDEIVVRNIFVRKSTSDEIERKEDWKKGER
jgi:hypothetical protein